MVVLPRRRAALRRLRRLRAAGQGFRGSRSRRSRLVVIVVSEIFGPTVQGEGPALGTRCGFVRLGRCPLACSWCDSAFSWDWSRYDPATELTEMSVDQIVERVETMEVDTIVLTGGEPLLQKGKLEPLVLAFRQRGWKTHVETAGTLSWQTDLVDRWVVSPKLANSGMEAQRRLKFDVLAEFAAIGAAFKFVVVEPSELDEVATIVDRVGAADVWIMPEGTTVEAIAARTAALADAVVARGWNLTTRLHVLAWGDERGR
ncbi:MAG TPA: 7-carboxy-7-deazaguanine synthase QueE [Acidimicrobiales bacterium]|nr:7-carboxy-7-deazaguanine synthase QueE [Acidimicrobiales bacterium]